MPSLTTTTTSPVTRLSTSLTFSRLLVFSALLRIALIVYSEWHDARPDAVVKYTDVDYRVFSDAARFVSHPSTAGSDGPTMNVAKGSMGGLVGSGDPYERATYRYTPLLALLLTPNEFLHPSFGKYLFAACDLAAGCLMWRILVRFVLPGAMSKDAAKPTQADEDKSKSSSRSPSTVVDPAVATAISHRATLLTAAHLLNPLVFSISTRGSSESTLSLLVLLALSAAYEGRWDAAAVWIGVGAHWKVYPAVYGVACLGVVGNVVQSGGLGGWRKWRWVQMVRFGIVSAGTFGYLGGVMYLIWGYPFLYNAYLYHLHRLDHRHNFSPYFYLIYLTYPSSTSLNIPISAWERLIRSPLTSFVPQMMLTVGAGLLFGRRREDLAFAWFVQTFVFVLFNKVCTSQYFLWYTLFLPLLVPSLRLSGRRAILCILVWVGTQALWLAEAYQLEFRGANVFMGLWARGLVYVVGNAWVLECVVGGYRLEGGHVRR